MPGARDGHSSSFVGRIESRCRQPGCGERWERKFTRSMNDEQAPTEHEEDLVRRLARAVGPVPEQVVDAAKAACPAAAHEPDTEAAPADPADD